MSRRKSPFLTSFLLKTAVKKVFSLNFRAFGKTRKRLLCLPLFHGCDCREHFHFSLGRKAACVSCQLSVSWLELRRKNKNRADVSVRTLLQLGLLFILADCFGPARRRCPGWDDLTQQFLFCCNINNIIKAPEGNPITQEAYWKAFSSPCQLRSPSL